MTRQNSFRFALPAVCGLALAMSGVVGAQTLSVDNSTFNLTVLSGGFAKQQLNLNTTSSTTVFVNTNSSPSWLSVSPTGPLNVFQGSPTAFTVIVNASGLAPGFTQSGTFTIGVQSSNATPITVTVNLTVGGPTALSTNPPSLSFTVPLGTPAANVPSQQVTIVSSVNTLGFNVTAVTQDGNSWLIPFTTSGNTNNAENIIVGVNPVNLQAGVYHGTIFVQSSTSSDSVAFPVTMTVTPPTSLSVTPTTLQPFLYQIGTGPQAGQLTRTLMVSSTNSAAGFIATLTGFNPPNTQWLVVSPPNGATGANGAAVPVTLTATPGQLLAGVYTAQLVITPIGGTSLTPIPVKMVISNNPLLQLSSNVLSFSTNFAATSQPPAQSVQVTTLGNGSNSFTLASDSSWLSVTSTNAGSGSNLTTPATLTISVNPQGLQVGSYVGTITVAPSGSDANLYSLPITINLSVGSTTTMMAGPPLLVFSAEVNHTPPTSQLVQLTVSGQPISFGLSIATVTAANCPGNWLAATSTSSSVSSVTPAIITVTPTTTSMTAGICSGSVTVTYPPNGANASTLTIPVTVNVNASSLLTIGMPLGFGQFSASQSGPSFTSTITLGSTDGTSVPFSATSSSNGNSLWLFVGSNGAATPQNLSVQIVPGNLPPNTYSGTITITSPNLPSSPVTIPVTLTISPSVAVTLSNYGPLNFAQPQGGALPAPQSITLASSGGTANFQVSVPNSSTCSWLQVSPGSGSATGAITFTPLANSLPQNTYLCPVTFSFLGSSTAPLIVNAVLTVGPSQTLSVSPPSLSFGYQLGSTAPPSQPLTISSMGGAVNFTVGTTSVGGWLVTDAGAATLTSPKTINVSIIPANIPSSPAGATIQGTVSISAPGVLASPLVVQVALTLATPSTPTPIIIFNSATGALGNGIAPGELITIKGLNLGPDTPAAGTSFSATSQGTVPNTLAGVQVLFSGVPGTPTYVSATQINVVVPWEMAGRSSANIVVSLNTVLSTPIPEAIVPVAPGVYTLNASGVGQAAALNSSPTNTVNGPIGGVPVTGGTVLTSPGVQGSVIAVYGTGGGLTTPQGIDGSLNSSVQLMPLLNWTPGSSVVTATIGGKPAVVTFAGAAPTLITGVWQINVQLPTGLASGPQALIFTIDGQQTQSNVTVAVQ